MELSLVQPGEAKPDTEDPARPRTRHGTETLGRMAVWASESGLKIAGIQHSGKRRA